MKTSEQIRKLRKSLNLSQEEFGKRLGVKKAAISKIENGENGLKEQMIILICKEFNVNRSWLIDGTGRMRVELSREEEITRYLGNLVKNDEPDNDFQKKFIRALSKLSTDEWKMIETFIDRLNEQKD